MTRQPTLHDVAAKAGVSHTTVSWALRGDPRISQATKERVLTAAEELGYSANEAARSLVRGRNQTIAIVSNSFSSAFESETLRGIEAEITAHPDYSLIQYSTGRMAHRAQAIYKNLLRSNKADAVICLADPPSPEIRQAYAEAQRILITFDENITDTPSICGDSISGSMLAAQYLVQRGYKHPLIVTGYCPQSIPSHCPDRHSTFVEACEGFGLSPQTLTIQSFTFQAGRDLVGAILESGCDVIYSAAGDLVAMGILAGLRQGKIPVPQAMGVIGYDNLQISSVVEPALTTIAQPLEEMGRTAIRTAFDALWGKAIPMKQVFKPELVIRASC